MGAGCAAARAHGMLILSDLRTESVMVVVPGTEGWRQRGKVGSSWGFGPGARGIAGSCLLILLRGPLPDPRNEGSRKVSLRACAPERGACMAKRNRGSGEIHVRTTSRPCPFVLLLDPQRGLESSCGARVGRCGLADHEWVDLVAPRCGELGPKLRLSHSS